MRGELNISSIDPPDYSPGIYCDKVLNPYRLGLNLAVSEHSGDLGYCPTMDQIGTEPNDRLGITGSRNNYPNAQVLYSELDWISLLIII